MPTKRYPKITLHQFVLAAIIVAGVLIWHTAMVPKAYGKSLAIVKAAPAESIATLRNRSEDNQAEKELQEKDYPSLKLQIKANSCAEVMAWKFFWPYGRNGVPRTAVIGIERYRQEIEYSPATEKATTENQQKQKFFHLGKNRIDELQNRPEKSVTLRNCRYAYGGKASHKFGSEEIFMSITIDHQFPSIEILIKAAKAGVQEAKDELFRILQKDKQVLSICREALNTIPDARKHIDEDLLRAEVLKTASEDFPKLKFEQGELSLYEHINKLAESKVEGFTSVFSIETLIDGAKEGVPQAMDLLFENLLKDRQIRSICYTALKDFPAVRERMNEDDLHAEVLKTVFEHLPRLKLTQGMTSLYSFIRTTAKNRVMDRARHLAVHNKNITLVQNPRPPASDPDSPVTRALSRISKEDKDLIKMHYSEGLTHEEMGERLKFHRNTIGPRLREALKRFRNQLQTEDPGLYEQLSNPAPKK